LTLKMGRPRQYDLSPLPDFADAEIALAAAALDELRARALDQIDDLSARALASVPEGLTFSAGALVAHMIWAETGWIRRATGVDAPADIRERLDPLGRALPTGERVAAELTAGELATYCRRVRDEQTVPALSRMSDIEAEVADPDRPTSVRGILMHLVWHWTYHSGQVGLLRDLYGADEYRWTFGSMGNGIHKEDTR
jgi:uncharacterized damage-inducible protein DinB